MKKDHTPALPLLKYHPLNYQPLPFYGKNWSPPSLFALKNSKTELPYIKVGGGWGNYVNMNQGYTFSLTLAPSALCLKTGLFLWSFKSRNSEIDKRKASLLFSILIFNHIYRFLCFDLILDIMKISFWLNQDAPHFKQFF